MEKSHGWRELSPVKFANGTVARVFTKGSCGVLITQEERKNGKTRWHLSISCADRYPHWDEIKDARYSLLPLGMYFAQILPPSDQYVNIHPNCFHLWEIDGIE